MVFFIFREKIFPKKQQAKIGHFRGILHFSRNIHSLKTTGEIWTLQGYSTILEKNPFPENVKQNLSVIRLSTFFKKTLFPKNNEQNTGILEVFYIFREKLIS